MVSVLVALALEGGLSNLWQGLFPELVSACAASSDMLCCPTKLSPGPHVRRCPPPSTEHACPLNRPAGRPERGVTFHAVMMGSKERIEAANRRAFLR